MSARRTTYPLDDDPLWYKDAVIYELHVRAFADSDDDGIGDFRGLVTKLDYLQELGVTAVWLLPFYPSPLRDDGYDIADYIDIHPHYGTLRDVQVFFHEAHRRGLRVITELVLNHTSDQHPWFQRARRAPRGSRAREMYVWSDTPDRYRQARVVFKDFETSNWTWDPVAGAYYWHRFYAHQPDLNYDNPRVHRAMLRVVDFWLQMGVDGLRLDAVPYLYEREGTNCENLPETIAFLRALRRHVDAHFRNRMLLAEANQWPEDVVPYLGDACHMAFHFPLMPRMFMAIHMEDRFPITDILDQTPPIPPTSQWALFLRNHDELTLEMVTDEERDYMYRVYAHDPQARINLGIRRRLAPLLGNHRRRIELMNGLLFSLPGSPVIYYGDEIGMGDNIYLGDRNGVRTPMQWSPDRNAGFSRANPQKLYLPVIIDPEYHYESVNVEAQLHNPHSLLWWMRRLIALRRRYQAFGRGSLELLAPENRKVLAFVRRWEAETILVVCNLSRFAQFAELDLSEFAGRVPVELFGRVAFPRIGALPYLLTLGPHAFYWFSLEPARERVRLPSAPVRTVAGAWPEVVRSQAFADALATWLPGRRWFGAKARTIKSVSVEDAVELDGPRVLLALVRVDYAEGTPDLYAVPLTSVPQNRLSSQDGPGAAVVRLASGDAVCDALSDADACRTLLRAIGARRPFRGKRGELVARRVAGFRLPSDLPEPQPLRAEQSNTSLVYGDRLILKLFRRVEPGPNPELEIGRLLTERRFAHAAPLVAALEYRAGRGEPATIAVLQGLVPNQGDAWQYTLDALRFFFESVMASRAPVDASAPAPLEVGNPPPAIAEAIGGYWEVARLLGRRTGELHRLLASSSDPAFAPEPFTPFYQQAIYQSMRTGAVRVLRKLRSRLPTLPAQVREEANRVADMERSILSRFRAVRDRRLEGMRIRIHGDYHLGQVLHTGRDFAIIDFEGEPARPLSERRIKRSPLRDVAGMLRSFHYAAFAALNVVESAGLVGERTTMEGWAQTWYRWVSAAFVQAYLETVAGSGLLPGDPEDLALLLEVLLLEKAVYEVGYELNNRPGWVRIPLRGILELMGSG
ncbi:MAG: maltose alpha-D-glucosyltransferase [Armatimonadota bacterium]|nr:maltose alpha-D-glucosyltransferase [Armatimonadota bacterium]MDR5697786.1 maltose alpha-D-glucosyltransferase [Armatimonadota bacterium]